MTTQEAEQQLYEAFTVDPTPVTGHQETVIHFFRNALNAEMDALATADPAWIGYVAIWKAFFTRMNATADLSERRMLAALFSAGAAMYTNVERSEAPSQRVRENDGNKLIETPLVPELLRTTTAEGDLGEDDATIVANYDKGGAIFMSAAAAGSDSSSPGWAVSYNQLRSSGKQRLPSSLARILGEGRRVWMDKLMKVQLPQGGNESWPANGSIPYYNHPVLVSPPYLRDYGEGNEGENPDFPSAQFRLFLDGCVSLVSGADAAIQKGDSGAVRELMPQCRPREYAMIAPLVGLIETMGGEEAFKDRLIYIPVMGRGWPTSERIIGAMSMGLELTTEDDNALALTMSLIMCAVAICSTCSCAVMDLRDLTVFADSSAVTELLSLRAMAVKGAAVLAEQFESASGGTIRNQVTPATPGVPPKIGHLLLPGPSVVAGGMFGETSLHQYLTGLEGSALATDTPGAVLEWTRTSLLLDQVWSNHSRIHTTLPLRFVAGLLSKREEFSSAPMEYESDKVAIVVGLLTKGKVSTLTQTERLGVLRALESAELPYTSSQQSLRSIPSEQGVQYLSALPGRDSVGHTVNPQWGDSLIPYPSFPALSRTRLIRWVAGGESRSASLRQAQELIRKHMEAEVGRASSGPNSILVHESVATYYTERNAASRVVCCGNIAVALDPTKINTARFESFDYGVSTGAVLFGSLIPASICCGLSSHAFEHERALGAPGAKPGRGWWVHVANLALGIRLCESSGNQGWSECTVEILQLDQDGCAAHVHTSVTAVARDETVLRGQPVLDAFEGIKSLYKRATMGSMGLTLDGVLPAREVARMLLSQGGFRSPEMLTIGSLLAARRIEVHEIFTRVEDRRREESKSLSLAGLPDMPWLTTRLLANRMFVPAFVSRKSIRYRPMGPFDAGN